MIFKNFNFNQTPRLVINGQEYTASNIINGVFHIYNKSQITLKNVWYKDNRDRQTNSLKFPPFSLVELYYGNDLSFFGVNKMQKGGSLSPFTVKHLDITVIDFKEWLTHKPLDFPIYNKSPEWVVNKVVSTLGESRITIGNLFFGKTDNIKAYSTQTKNAYDTLRMLEKKTQSILQIVPNGKAQLEINFYTRDSIKLNKTGVQIDLSSDAKTEKFYKDHVITGFDWKESLTKFANKIRVQSEQAIGETLIKIPFNLSGGEETTELLKPVGNLIKNNAKLYDLNNNFIRKLVVVTSEEANKGKLFDISYQVNSKTITFGKRLVGKNQIIKMEYYPIVSVEYQMDDVKSQQEIASYSGSNGILFRTEKHNDETSPSDLIALGEGYKEKNSQPRISLTITSRKAIWDLGEHTNLNNTFEPAINGDYVVYKASIKQIVDVNGEITTEFKYELMNSLDYDEELNKHDSQAYRDNPIFETNDVVFDTREDINEYVTIKIKNFICNPIDFKQDNLELNNELNFNTNPIGDVHYEIIQGD